VATVRAAWAVAATSGAALAGRVPAVAEHVCGRGVEVADLAQEQVQHRGDVAALVAQERHRLAGDPHRGHRSPQLVREHGDVIGRPCRPTR
jgi:hypothetical protein